MTVTCVAKNVPHALEEMLWKVKIFGKEEYSRNGGVLSIQEPVALTITRPAERVLTDPRRNANPFFHLAEFVWMMGGSNDVRVIEKYNRRMREYADPGTHVHHGAYGYRWRVHFGRDQIVNAIGILRAQPTSRRAVLGMWDPRTDLENHNDLPCNTHVYLRIIDDGLDFTVCNRSNDLVWGCLGANAVHMTYLHELIARALGIRQGQYHVLTNNMHVYRDRPDVVKLIATPHVEDVYRQGWEPYPLLAEGEDYNDFLIDCATWVHHNATEFRTAWMNLVFAPAMRNWMARETVVDIAAEDWRVACREWLERRAPQQLELPLNTP